MSDLELLYLVTVAFYLWECTQWLGFATVPFVSWVGGSFRVTQPFFVATSREAGLVFASPLPLSGTLFVSAEWPVAVSPSGVSSRDGSTVHFGDQPRFTARRRWLLAGGQRFARVGSATHAWWLATALNDLSATPVSGRTDQVRQLLRGTLDLSQAADRRREFQQTASLSSTLATGVFLYVFFIVPAVIWRTGLMRVWPWLLGGLVALCVVNAAAFHRAHKQLHPRLDDERFSQFLMILLFPPAAMRARDMLSRPVLERFHPLALAKTLCDDDSFKALAGRTLRELRYPCRSRTGTSTNAQQIWESHRSAMLEEVQGLVSRSGLSLDTLTTAPARQDPECKTYCPRCHAQFTRADGTCSDCGVSLVRFG